MKQYQQILKSYGLKYDYCLLPKTICKIEFKKFYV